MCDGCLGDEDLKQFIRNNAVSMACTFCGARKRSRAIAADAQVVVEYIEERLGQEFEDAVHEVPYESAEGGYQANIRTSREILWDVGFEATNDNVFEYISQELPDYAWVERDFFSIHPYQTLKHGWDEFSATVKHRTRYLFFESLADDAWPQHDEIRPEAMLAALGRVIERSGLVRTIPAGSRLVRVRQHSASESPSTLSELGPPPPARAVYSNRMSPSGISMLYTAENEATAIRETIRRRAQGVHFTVAQLQIVADTRIVDFTRLPELHGIFAPTVTREERADERFVRAFVRDLSKPIKRDGREHIEYVPTQVVPPFPVQG